MSTFIDYNSCDLRKNVFNQEQEHIQADLDFVSNVPLINNNNTSNHQDPARIKQLEKELM